MAQILDKKGIIPRREALAGWSLRASSPCELNTSTSCTMAAPSELMLMMQFGELHAPKM